MGALRYLPKTTRERLVVKGANPKPMTCPADIEPGFEPFEKLEVVPGLVWRVRFKYLVDPAGLKMLKTLFGIDFREAGASASPEMKPIVSKDIERWKNVYELKRPKEILQAGGVDSQDMLVAKLKCSGGLLLFNPCLMRESMKSWLATLGPVRWIVSGSSSHTNYLPQAAEAFPDAKLLISSCAEAKIVAVGSRSAQFKYDVSEELASANGLLEAEGLSAHYVVGDVFADALLVLAHSVLFEVDLAYGSADKETPAATEAERFRSEEALSPARCFYYSAVYGDRSPNGCLPAYRFSMMDPRGSFNKAGLTLKQPDSDGSSCLQMAASLRTVLSLKFDQVLSVHSFRLSPMPAEEFRACIDACWQWLDGKSLLTKVSESGEQGQDSERKQEQA
eukprot:TRINITY_DN10344_c0_g1_i1.p1 TRINITY_DN10344_c0_g1~~TRINITY_DN10344_c0_g1_i1.p1  ORF type:complete len:440 (-),score=48.45 TRINITY_DN10344_c0_g1_i1:27-1202(-)